MPRAWCLIRENPHYRRQAFIAGLSAAGYTVRGGEPGAEVAADDALLIWNRYSHWEQLATQFERRGGRVLVTENGYLGAQGSTPKFDVAPGAVRPEHYYALAWHQHNGAGVWPRDDGRRWQALGVALQPWRTDGKHILVCPQRGIGAKTYAQRPEWPQDVCRRLHALTRRPVRVRPHPGLGPGAPTLAEDLRNCWAVVTWASGAGIHALIAGVPVYVEAPAWILADAAERDLTTIDAPACRERRPAFERLACAQWTVAEIESGEAFKTLLAGGAAGRGFGAHMGALGSRQSADPGRRNEIIPNRE